MTSELYAKQRVWRMRGSPGAADVELTLQSRETAALSYLTHMSEQKTCV